MLRPFGIGGQSLRAASNRRTIELRRLKESVRRTDVIAYARGKCDGVAEEEQRNTRVMAAPRGGSILLGPEPTQRLLRVIPTREEMREVPEYSLLARNGMFTLAVFEAQQKATVVDGRVIRWFDWVQRA